MVSLHTHVANSPASSFHPLTRCEIDCPNAQRRGFSASQKTGSLRRSYPVCTRFFTSFSSRTVPLSLFVPAASLSLLARWTPYGRCFHPPKFAGVRIDRTNAALSSRLVHARVLTPPFLLPCRSTLGVALSDSALLVMRKCTRARSSLTVVFCCHSPLPICPCGIERRQPFGFLARFSLVQFFNKNVTRVQRKRVRPLQPCTLHHLGLQNNTLQNTNNTDETRGKRKTETLLQKERENITNEPNRYEYAYTATTWPSCIGIL